MNLRILLIAAVVVFCIVMLAIALFTRRQTIGDLHKKGNGSYDTFAQRITKYALRNEPRANRTVENFQIADTLANTLLRNDDVDKAKINKAAITQRLAEYNRAALNGINARAIDNAQPQVNHIIRRIDEFAVEVGDDQLDHQLQMAIAQSTRDQAAAAANGAKSAEDKVTKYINIKRAVSNDAQNVHDPHVNADLRTSLRKIIAENDADPAPLVDKAAIIQYITERGDIPLDIKQRALATLDKVAAGNTLSALGGLDELAILQNIWKRSELPQNAAQSDNIREAIIDALADATTRGSTVCVNGRVGRIVYALAFVDADPTVGQVNSIEMIRNELFNTVHQRIRARLAAVGGELERGYNDSAVALTDAQVAELNGILDAVCTTVLTEYADRLPAKEIEKIRIELTAIRV